MKIDFKKSFSKDLKKIKDKNILKKVKALIDTIENTPNLMEIKNVKQLTSGGKYYRIKIGAYRVGIKLENEIVVFVRFLHRREIYRYFPF
ncbi:type II toxin-antitoxin system RelE/ParE family toxin [Candidatus Kuenenia sp.]|uniref:type II toxin-antitoxin system RelE family toxin n=1 Tax=Candidatus Kuenenia sp. TaxID=2499824 RepID=UPI00321FA3AB